VIIRSSALSLVATGALGGACLEPLHGGRAGEREVTASDAEVIADVTEPEVMVADDTPGAVAVAAALDGLRWELPCLERVQADICATHDEMRTATDLEGEPGARYAVTVHVRGVVEEKSYTTGVWRDGLVQRDGAPIAGDWNVYALEISDPPARYFLNGGTAGAFHVVRLDARFTFEARAGATVTLVATAFDGLQIPNIDRTGEPLYVPDVAPWPAAFDGQFIQLDVVHITTP
jgi:hypothetical protein